MERSPRPPWERDQRTQASQAGELMGVGIQFAASIVFFLLVGRWVDVQLGTTPLFLILGVFLGAGGGFYAMYRRLVIKPRERQEQEKREQR
ncbi:MAG: AtpZ/AtpI family protein [Chloroflexota bacterium]|nr:AtpZ/AtpI family protein [Chloroflexota bacterium]